MNYDDHQKKFEDANLLIEDPIMDPEETSHFDWLVIIMYYGAYHLVHKHCANRARPFHPKGHGSTLNEARRGKKGREVYRELEFLSNECFNARYKATSFSREDIQELKESYNLIKKNLA